MLSDLLFVLNGVVPIFAVMAVGCLLRRKDFLTEGFTAVADKLVFRLLLPAFLYTKVAAIDRSQFGAGDVKLVGFALTAVLVITFGTFAVSSVFIKEKATRGAFVQAVYRSNTAILGVPFAENLFGTEGAKAAAVLLAFIVPLYNVLAVIILTLCDPTREKGQGKGALCKQITSVLKGIVTNPLIIAIALALCMTFADLTLPAILDKTVGCFAGASTPIALLALGAGFRFGDLRGRVVLTAVATALKLVVFPYAAVVFAALLGFSGPSLGALFIIFGTPCAVSSYIMAKNMHSDYVLAGQVAVMTMLFSAFTVTLGSFLLYTLGFVAR